jgi:mono/diheme cytochrome c family protein
MLRTLIVITLAAALLLSACAVGSAEPSPAADPTAQPDATAPAQNGPGMGMGMRGGMMARHSAPVPEEYAALRNPAAADDESLERGAALYVTHCESCHGATGMGEGAAGVALDPPAAPIAHTSRMMSDGYLFWRISEGGAPFNTAMPAWKDTLTEEERWDLINAVRALGAGQTPGGMMGSGAGSGEAEMLAQAVEQGVLTEEEADLFSEVHAALEEYIAQHTSELPTGSPEARQTAALEALTAAGTITAEQAEAFTTLHDLLVESGLMQ